MSIRLKIFGAFMLIVLMGVSLVVARSISTGRMIDKINEQHRLQSEAINYRTDEMRRLAESLPADMRGDIDRFIQKSQSYDDAIYNLGAEVIEAGDSGSAMAVVLAIPTIIACFLTAFIISWWIAKKLYFYEDILDHIPLPLSITDNNRKCIFINKPVEDLLHVKRAAVLGKHCADVWKAGICNTADCGIECLERGHLSTMFEQRGMSFKVDTAYLKDSKQRKVGHIEAVQEITQLMSTQKSQGELITSMRDVSDTFSSISAELTAETQTNANTAAEAARLAERIKLNAEKSSEQMAELIQAINEINEANHAIVNVTTVIKDIARRTNILALNASVEAVRGGQYGKSFAVVAEEVRTLAIQSSNQVRDTEVLIQNSIEKAKLGAEIAKLTAGSLGEIVEGISDSNTYIEEIALSSEQQNTAINELHSRVGKISSLLGENN